MTTSVDIARVFTMDNARKTGGAVLPGSPAPTETVEVEKLRAEWAAKSNTKWPTSVSGFKKLLPILTACRDSDPVSNGDAEAPYKVMAQVMADNGDVQYVRIIGAKAVVKAALPTGYEMAGSKLVATVDIAQFQTEVQRLVAKIDLGWVSKSVMKQSAEQDFFYLVDQMLEVEESYDLIGLLSARLLMGKEDRDVIDTQLGKVTILLNKTGKLSQGLVRMGGFIGLAAVKGEPIADRACRFVVNPLLGQDVVDRPVVQRGVETADEFKIRKEKHDRTFLAYKAIMQEMKAYKSAYENLPKDKLDKVKTAVLRVAFQVVV